jgi:hypothetical protein
MGWGGEREREKREVEKGTGRCGREKGEMEKVVGGKERGENREGWEEEDGERKTGRGGW